MRTRRRKSREECQAYDCTGGSMNRQRPLMDGEIEQLDEQTKALIRPSTKRCTYCGCVYGFESREQAIVYGTLNNDILGRGWHPSKPTQF